MTKENLKICCSFKSFMEKEKIKTELEKDLIEWIWKQIKDKEGLCENCKHN